MTKKIFDIAPLDLVGFSLGTGVGGRPDIGLQNEYVSEWWSSQTPQYWQFIRANALVGMGGQAQGDLLNEATGRMPTLNNGGPGANHAGAGIPYAGLGTLFPNTRLFGGSLIEQGVAPALENVPYSDCTVGSQCSNMAFGPIFTLTDNTHQSAFALGVYQVSGSEMYVPALEDAGLRAQYGYGGLCNWLVNSGVTGDGMDCTINGVTYYTLLGPGDERRGQAWAMRDVAAAAAFGDDSFYGPERTYFNDDLTETYWFNVACGLGCGLIDPPAPTSGIVLGGGEGTLSPSISPGNNDILNNVDAIFSMATSRNLRIYSGACSTRRWRKII
jgi:hypothetical protein